MGMNMETNTGETVAAAKTASAKLWRHDKRPSWGLAVIMWERNGKRAYQFEDGEVRVIKEGFYNLLSPATAPGDGTGRSVVRMARRRAGGDDATLPTVRHQMEYMRSQYPEGFDDPAWFKQHRGEGRRLKRHRDPALADAARAWSMAALNAYLEAGDWRGIVDSAVEVLKGTDLVTAAHVKKLAGANATEALARSFVTLIHDHDAPRAIERFRDAVKAAGGPANSWNLMTAPRALANVDGDVCVRPSVMKIQARILIPGFSPSATPNAKEYAEYLRAARALRDELEAGGLEPRDMLDVYDFIWLTLRPAVRDEVMAALDGPSSDDA